MADIHFDYRLAIAAMENGADKIRINPGNIGSRERLNAVVQTAKAVSYTHLMRKRHKKNGSHVDCRFWRHFLLDDFDPAFRSLDAAHLDAGKGFVKFLGDWTHFLHAAGEADLFAVCLLYTSRCV